jgi:hypothetical protein
MEEFHKNGDYRHIQRVKAIAAFQQKDHRTAMAAMGRELTTSPFSVISQRYYIAMLEGVPQSDPAEKQAAFEKFLLLCSWRKVAPENSIRITPETDDGAFPADVRKKMFPAETVSLF